MSDTTIIIATVERLYKSLEARIERLESMKFRERHGSSGYTNGCRCVVCKTARKNSMRIYRAKLKGEK